jgi:hypothetical protein
VFVSRDSFSDFVTTSIIKSEQAEDLKEGIISTSNNARRNSEIVVRVDNAPGVLSLIKKKDKDLCELNIKLENSDKENQNGLAKKDSQQRFLLS